MFFMVPKAQALEAGFRDALHTAVTLAATAGSYQAAIAVHVKDQVQRSAISAILGEQRTKQLLKGSVDVSGVKIHLITERIRSGLIRGPLVAAYVAPTFLDKLIKEKRFTDIIYIPWNPKEEAAFHDQYKPNVISAPPGWVPPSGPPARESILSSQPSTTPTRASTAVSIGQETATTQMKRPHVVLLGAGASFAACRKGDATGKALPLMSTLTKLLPLDHLVPEAERGANFEEYYGRVASDAAQHDRAEEMERVIYDYFDSMALPDEPTIYDYLLLSLRAKDVVATFNWDPFLLQAARRNAPVLAGHCPHLLFLHGNVLEGVCQTDRVLGMKGANCSQCGKPLEPTPLLYPIGKKDYSKSPELADTWNTLSSAFKAAFMITVFGYSAPKSDGDAVALLKEAWGALEDRQFEQFEIIDIRSEKSVVASWKDFIHTHHYEVHRDFFKSSLMRHPRRTGEDFINRILMGKWTTPNPPPRAKTLSKLHEWYRTLIPAEESET